MEYLQNGLIYKLDYQDLKNRYNEAVQMSNEDFVSNIPELLHLAVFICNIKGTKAEHCLSDDGIIHEMVHLLIDPSMPEKPIEQVRENFKTTLQLA